MKIKSGGNRTKKGGEGGENDLNTQNKTVSNHG